MIDTGGKNNQSMLNTILLTFFVRNLKDKGLESRASTKTSYWKFMKREQRMHNQD